MHSKELQHQADRHKHFSLLFLVSLVLWSQFSLVASAAQAYIDTYTVVVALSPFSLEFVDWMRSACNLDSKAAAAVAEVPAAADIERYCSLVLVSELPGPKCPHLYSTHLSNHNRARIALSTLSNLLQCRVWWTDAHKSHFSVLSPMPRSLFSAEFSFDYYCWHLSHWSASRYRSHSVFSQFYRFCRNRIHFGLGSWQCYWNLVGSAGSRHLALFSRLVDVMPSTV